MYMYMYMYMNMYLCHTIYIHIACMATQYVCTFRYMYMTLIGMHELHGQMHPN